MRTFILTFICFVAGLRVLAQKTSLVVDAKIVSSALVVKDTAIYPDLSDSTGVNEIKLPINAAVELKSINNALSFNLIHCNALKNKTATRIHVTSAFRYGVDVDLFIDFGKQPYEVTLFYNAVNIDYMSELTVSSSKLTLNTRNFEKGKLLVGKITFSFSGSIVSAETGQKEMLEGTGNGTFTTRIE